MAAFPNLLILWCTICCFVCSADNSFMIPLHRELGDTATTNVLSKIRKRHGGTNPVVLGKSLYWFGNFSVGDSPHLKLLIDTGSSDLLVNTGLYKPSKNVKPYVHKNFTILYEGVNRQGFGFETVKGTVTRDVVSAGGLTITDQPLGNVTSFKYIDAHPLREANPGQGIIGFLGRGSSSFRPGAPSWFFNLCKQKVISQCKLGLAFGTSGKGLSVIGKLASNLYEGDLTVAPRIVHPYESFTVLGDIAISDKIVFKNQTIIMDCGTDNIQGPVHVVRKIFDMLGYQTVETNGRPNPFDPRFKLKVIKAFFPCDKPPTLGFSFPAQSVLQNPSSEKISKTSKIFNVSPLVWNVYDHGNNNCTSILGGTNALNNPKKHTTAWLLGFANLKNPSAPSDS